MIRKMGCGCHTYGRAVESALGEIGKDAMTDTANIMEQLRDEEYVRGIIEDLGGVQSLVAGMQEYHQIVVRMQHERASLMKGHPDQWVAMGRDGVVAIGDSIDEVIEEAEAQGLRGSDLVIEFLDTNPPVLIL